MNGSVLTLWDRIVTNPYESFVATASLIPPCFVLAWLVGFRMDSAVLELTMPFFILWGLISFIGSVNLWWGILGDTIKPAIFGLRATAIAWSTYLALIVDDVTQLRGWILVTCGFIAVAISVIHSTNLSRRVKLLKRTAKEIEGSE